MRPSSQLYAPPSYTRPTEVFSPPEALSDNCDGESEDEIEGDPAAFDLDGGHQRWERSVAARP